MLDRGEEADWFGSPRIRLFAMLAVVGIVGAVAWLSMIEKPVLNLRALADRNFAVGSVMIFGVGAVLYSTNVLIPLLAEAQFGYTALLAGELMVPGAIMMLLLNPMVGRVIMPRIDTRYVIAFGFFSLGAALLYARDLAPQMSFGELVVMRAALTLVLAFLFVPNSTIAYSTLPRSLTADATALYAMFRNIAGSAGIALVTMLVTRHMQAHRAYLAQHLTPFDQPYQALVGQYSDRLRELGWTSTGAHDTAMGLINQMLGQQAAFLAYGDVFEIKGNTAFAIVPLTLLFRSARRRAPSGAHWRRGERRRSGQRAPEEFLRLPVQRAVCARQKIGQLRFRQNHERPILSVPVRLVGGVNGGGGKFRTYGDSEIQHAAAGMFDQA